MSKIKYLHYRLFDKNGKPGNRGGATVAYTDFTGEPIRFATALCHYKHDGIKDNFNRKRGRQIAAGRLKKDVRVEEHNDTEELFLLQMDEFFAQTYGYYRRRKDVTVVTFTQDELNDLAKTATAARCAC